MTTWSVFTSAFLSVFLAELGDKTQFAAFTLAASSGQKWPVFFGASIALVTSTLIAVMLADAAGRFMNPVLIKRLAGIVFIVLGILYIKNSLV